MFRRLRPAFVETPNDEAAVGDGSFVPEFVDRDSKPFVEDCFGVGRAAGIFLL